MNNEPEMNTGRMQDLVQRAYRERQRHLARRKVLGVFSFCRRFAKRTWLPIALPIAGYALFKSAAESLSVGSLMVQESSSSL